MTPASRVVCLGFLLQMLFNPDPGAANFGSSVEFMDYTGDGIADFIVGADGFNTPNDQNAGAVYIWPVLPITGS